MRVPSNRRPVCSLSSLCPFCPLCILLLLLLLAADGFVGLALFGCNAAQHRQAAEGRGQAKGTEAAAARERHTMHRAGVLAPVRIRSQLLLCSSSSALRPCLTLASVLNRRQQHWPSCSSFLP
jgi:hypothetical protein